MNDPLNRDYLLLAADEEQVDLKLHHENDQIPFTVTVGELAELMQKRAIEQQYRREHAGELPPSP